jgi:hypothetical protein
MLTRRTDMSCEIREDIVFEKLGDEIVILHVSSKESFRLSGSLASAFNAVLAGEPSEALSKDIEGYR